MEEHDCGAVDLGGPACAVKRLPCVADGYSPHDTCWRAPRRRRHGQTVERRAGLWRERSRGRRGELAPLPGAQSYDNYGTIAATSVLVDDSQGFGFGF